jgi:hypothetical protein
VVIPLFEECIPRPLAATGQTKCYNANGDLISCDNTGQDGELRMGVKISPRFVNNGDGTVIDKLTGLIWLRNSKCIKFFLEDNSIVNDRSWLEALDAVKKLSFGYCGLTDGSEAGDWRLPNVRELESLVDYDHSQPAIDSTAFPDTEGSYWSSTTLLAVPHFAWYVSFDSGGIGGYDKYDQAHVRPVRGGK